MPIAEGFVRRLKPDDFTRIESRCDFCGFLIVANAHYDLYEQEREHRKGCPDKR